MQKYTYIYWIHTDAMNNRRNDKDAGRLLYQNIYLSLYCKGSKRVTQGLRVRGSWRPNRNCNILTLTLLTVNVVSFSFFWCSTGGPWPTLLDDGFLYCILSASSVDPNSSGPQVHSAWCGFPYHISSPTVCNSTRSSNSTELYNRSTPTRSLKSNV